MTEEKFIETINGLLFLAGAFLFYGLMFIEPQTANNKPIMDIRRDFAVPLPQEQWWNDFRIEKFEPVFNKAISEEAQLRNIWMSTMVTYETIELDYCGRHYITAYCPEECGYNGSNYPTGWTTSSGSICHYSDDPMVPTTCAIDRSYHKYGEYLMVDGKIYVTEDTGPGVRGLWVDVFVETMDEVHGFGSHYTDVYNVTFYTHHTQPHTLHRVFYELIDHRNGPVFAK